MLLSERTKRNAMERVRELTPRNWGNSLADCILGINAWLRGWHGFFGIASVTEMQMMRKIDAHIRRRLRAIILRHWKRKRTIAKRLVALGVNQRAVLRQVYRGRRSWWALSHANAVEQALRNAYSQSAGSCRSSACTVGHTSTTPPPSATTGAMGMTSRSHTGRRRG